MMPHASRRLLVAVAVVLATSAASALSQAQPFPWWRAVRDLGLSTDQSAKIDGIFQSTMPELRQDLEELDRLEAKLSRLIESNADEAQVLRQIDRVESQRGTVNKVRTLMLIRMRQVLTPDQRARFKAMQERWEAERGAGNGRGRQGPPGGGSGSNGKGGGNSGRGTSGNRDKRD